jgi:hypothetical protein
MFNPSFIKRYVTYAVILAIGILIGLQLMGAAAASAPSSAEGVPAQATDSQANSLEPSDTTDWYTCTPWKVATYGNRVHVECTVATGDGFKFFATPTSDYKNAARILSLLLTAKATTRDVEVLYDPDDDTSGVPWGCLAADCRPILGVVNR